MTISITELELKQNEYRWYIFEHQRMVRNFFLRYFYNNYSFNEFYKRYNFSKKDSLIKRSLTEMGISDYDSVLETTYQNILKHDESKFSEEEFEPYRRMFYPTLTEKRNMDLEEPARRDFERAWKHHYENNPHHPEYWNRKDMDIPSIIEMICDWIAMSYYFKSSLYDWYENKADDEKKAMSKRTRNTVDDILYHYFKEMRV